MFEAGYRFPPVELQPLILFYLPLSLAFPSRSPLFPVIPESRLQISFLSASTATELLLVDSSPHFRLTISLPSPTLSTNVSLAASN